MDCFQQTVALYIIIGGLLNGLDLAQQAHLPDKPFPVECVWMVKANDSRKSLLPIGFVSVLSAVKTT